MRFALHVMLLFVLSWLSCGCSRTRYRMAADRDTYQVIREKASSLTHRFPNAFTVRPDKRSRFYDPTNPDCPQLPIQRPILRGYEIPQLASDQMTRPMVMMPGLTTSSDQPLNDTANAAIAGPAPAEPIPASAHGTSLTLASSPAQFATAEINQAPTQTTVVAMPTIQATNMDASTGAVIPASYQDNPTVILVQEPVQPQDAQPANSQSANPQPPNAGTSQRDAEKSSRQSAAPPPPPTPGLSLVQAKKVTIPAKAWEVLPQNCLDRMLEFDSLRREYAQTFEDVQLDDLNKQQRKLTLANLVELANINSREYQARKEVLYRTALTLTRQRYQYDLNPIPFGNGTAANFRHLRNRGTTQNTLGVPSGVGFQKTLATGGQFLASFANSVVLTFNGPSGFAADVGSELVFDFQQTLLQRDIRFEALTQNERDVLYAARDYLRFRKQLFRDVAGLYYNLLVSYRGIEINAQDYFTNLRGFLQSQAEYRTAEKIPRFQVDQFEQNVLRTRSNLVNNCFALEAALDQLKFRLGLPTEMVLTINLAELESISLRDELSVARQMINRARAELLNTRSTASMDSATVANVAEVLADRMDNILRIQARMDEVTRAESGEANQAAPDAPNSQAIAQAREQLEQLTHRLQILGVRIQVDELRAELDAQFNADTPPPPLRVLIRAIDLCSSELQIIDLALNVPADSKRTQVESDRLQELLKRRNEAVQRLNNLMDFMDELSAKLGPQADPASMALFEKIPTRMQESVALVDLMKKLALDATKDILPAGGPSIEENVRATVDQTIVLSDRLLEKGPDGWQEIVLDHDEALLTGLVQRLDLMNQRGDLADAWRQIKLAGDDLRSIVDLRATQILRTDPTTKDPTNFSFDDSETRLSVALDTPLNRRLQRNNFRAALINYNVGLRNLMAAEDAIKLDIREDLRQLALDRNQYTIAVASAALAFERVISTRMRLQLAVPNVAARDFLEAQQAYTNALSSIARQHVNYITDRIELFFDLEAFDVDNCGYWAGVSEDYGPQINVDFPSMNPKPYDSLPPRVHYSPTIRQMEAIPPGRAEIRP